MVQKPVIVTLRLDQATRDRMRRTVPYTKYGTTSSFIREGIESCSSARTSNRPDGRYDGNLDPAVAC
jgi:Arc/MetJ-type ribon-helix-helix transcriptional regulator